MQLISLLAIPTSKFAIPRGICILQVCNCFMFNLNRKLLQFLLKTSLFVGDVNSWLMGSTKIEPPRNIMISQ